MRPFYLFFLFFLIGFASLPRPSYGQFTSVTTFGGAGNENGYHLLSDQDAGFYVAGTFDAPFSPVDTPLSSYGEEDFFIGQLDANNQWIWIKSGGSFLGDEIRILRQLSNGDLLIAGTFWLELKYEDQILKTTDNIKGIFMVRLDGQGNWQWGKVINGADLKEINDVKIAPNGNIFLSGHFSEALEFETQKIEATGKNDAFLLKLNPQGQLLDWKQLGYKGSTRGQAIALHPDGGFYWGGVYDDTLRIGTTELYANTFDRDLFLSRYNAEGKLLWARRAGGVFEEEYVAMETDAEGNLVATGFLIGVMTLSDSISIQSRNGSSDIFLFKYNELGQAQWARSIGGDLIDQPTALSLLNEKIVISGIYQGKVAWDELSSPMTNGTNGFVAGFDPVDGTGNWLTSITSESFAFVEALSTDINNRLFVLGSFRDSAQLGRFNITSPGQYDFFLTGITSSLTPVYAPPISLPITIYPNPANDFVRLEGLNGQATTLSLYDQTGKLVKTLVSQKRSEVVNLEAFAPGVYSLIARQGAQMAKIRLIIAR